LTPGAHLRAEIRRLGLDQVAVSKAAGVSRQSINNIINDRQTISRAMAGKLGRLTGRSSDYWLSESFPSGARASAKPRPRLSPVGVLVNHQIVRAVEDGIIGIEPFVVGNVQAASIELTLGDVVADNRGKDFVLEPGRSARASTNERIEMPRDYLGRIGAATRLASLGVIASCTLQVEPGFKGRLQFWLFNASGAPVALRPLAPVISLELLRLAAVPDVAT
jgi:addiction module HigA family antidote